MMSSTNIYQQLTSVSLCSTQNEQGSYYNGNLNNGVGARIVFSSTFTEIDGELFNLNDRILLSSQTNSNENGIYVVTQIADPIENLPAIFTRSNDFQSIEQLKLGQFLSVNNGVSSIGSIFVLSYPLPLNIGTPGNNIIFKNSVDSGSSLYLKKINNLSDVNSIQQSRENIGFGSGSEVNLTDSDFSSHKYLITSPSPFIINVNVTNSLDELILPNLFSPQALYPGSSIIINNNISSNDILVKDFIANSLATLSPGESAIFNLVDNSTQQGSWDIQSISGIVRSWNGSLSPVDVTAGSGIDITDGVISLTGSGPSAAYGFTSSQNLSNIISWTDNTTWKPLNGGYLFNITNNFIAGNDFTNGPFYLQYVGLETSVFEIVIACSLQRFSSNTACGYWISASLDGSTPISSSNAQVSFCLDGNGFAAFRNAQVITYTIQIQLNPNDKVYYIMKNAGSTSTTDNDILPRQCLVTISKIGDTGGASSGVTSLNGLTGDLQLNTAGSLVITPSSPGPSDINIDVAPLGVDLTSMVSGILPISNGGTNADGSSYASNGVFFYNGTLFNASSSLNYNGSNRFEINNASSDTRLISTTTLTGSPNGARLYLQRGDLTFGTAEIIFSTAGIGDWQSGTYPNSSNYSIKNSGIVRFSIDTSGNVNISSLSPSQLVITDSSSNLISGGPPPIVLNSIVTISSSSKSFSFQTRYVNAYSGGVMNGTLPTATGSGKSIELISLSTSSTSGWVVTAQGTDKIQFNGNLSASGGNLTSTVGSNTDCATFIDVAANLWLIYPADGLSLTVT